MARLAGSPVASSFVVVVIFFFFFFARSSAAAGEYGLRGLRRRGERTTHLHFYFQELSSGPNMSVMRVAQTNATDSTAARFGEVSVADNPLTEGPELASKLVGRAQGMYAAASREQFTLLLALNFVFTEGKYGGGVLAMAGSNPIFNSMREIPILGGSGYFRLARGHALLTTVGMNQSTGLVTVKYNVTVVHRRRYK